ncbi:four-carbon acid sugar kinase family protein [uncultured Draconibacterium sp.]|uniref:four-carbon acid sugar kinase family protein n=1 Tax=uncultured Draconibacterium sp. TaxID=1573823 RepID=UPI003261C70C
MIAVIADDFTGAAEIGGIGLKYGLKVVIETQVNWVEGTDLLIIAADTRSLPEEAAFLETEKITTALLELNPEYIFKKLDSVLRGNIVAELMAQLKSTGKKRAIMVAGNPSFGRLIVDGKYSVNGVPLAETSFADDPDFPVKSSDVTQIVESDMIAVYSASVDNKLPGEGIIVGDVKSQEDMIDWVERIDGETVVAGGAGFFDTILMKQFAEVKADCKECFELGDVSLLVFGSKYPKADSMPMGLSGKNTVKINMPDAIYENSSFDEAELKHWAENVVNNLKNKFNVIVSADQNHSNEANLSARIGRNTAELVKIVVESIPITDLLIEGGATTSEILKVIGVNKLFPGKLVYPGIIQMSTKEYPNMAITTKPGSYPWPDTVELTKTKNKIVDKI